MKKKFIILFFSISIIVSGTVLFLSKDNYSCLNTQQLQEHIGSNNIDILTSKNIGNNTLVLSNSENRISTSLLTVDKQKIIQLFKSTTAKTNPFNVNIIKDIDTMTGKNISYAFFFIENEKIYNKTHKLVMIFENKEITIPIDNNSMIVPLDSTTGLLKNLIAYDNNGLEIYNRDKCKGIDMRKKLSL